MEQSFSKYLAEKKSQNGYSSEFILNEGIGEFLKTNIGELWHNAMRDGIDCYTVTINLTDPGFIDIIAKKLVDGKLDDSLTKGEDHFIDSMREDIAEICTTLCLKAKDVKLFCGMTCTDTSLIAYFRKGGKDEPDRGVNQFKTEIEHDPDISVIAKYLEIGTATPSKKGLANSENNGLNLDWTQSLKNNKKFMSGAFMNKIIENIKQKVKNVINDQDKKRKMGDQVEVSFIPFKIDETDINAIAKSADSLLDFYKNMAEEINKKLEEMKNSISDENKEDYIGFVPNKKYGFNLYFKNAEVAYEAAELLNGDDGQEPRKRMKFEKQISKYPKTLADKGDMVAYFRGLTYTRSVINKFLIDHYNDKFAGAEDQVAIKEIAVSLDKDDILKLANINIDSDDDVIIQGEASKKVKEFANTIHQAMKDAEGDKFIGLTGNGTNIIFTFKNNITPAAVAKPIINYLKCEVKDLKLVSSVMTNDEIENMNTMGIQSFTNAIANIIKTNKATEKENNAKEKEIENNKFIPVNTYTVDLNVIEEMTGEEVFNLMKTLSRNESVANTFKQSIEYALRKSINLVTEATKAVNNSIINILTDETHKTTKLKETEDGDKIVEMIITLVKNHLKAWNDKLIKQYGCKIEKDSETNKFIVMIPKKDVDSLKDKLNSAVKHLSSIFDPIITNIED